eukprot:RCo043044
MNMAARTVYCDVPGKIEEVNNEIERCLRHKQLLSTARDGMNAMYSLSFDEVRRRIQAIFEYLRRREAELLEQMKAAADRNLTRLSLAERQVDLQIQSLKAEMERLELLREMPSAAAGSEKVLQECRRLSAGMSSSPALHFPPALDSFQPDLGPGALQLFAFQTPLSNTVRIRTQDLLGLDPKCCHHMGGFFSHGLGWFLGVSVSRSHLGLFAVLHDWPSVQQCASVEADFSLTVRRVRQDPGPRKELLPLHPATNSREAAQNASEAAVLPEGKPVLAVHTLHHSWTFSTESGRFGVANALPLKKLRGVEWVDLLLEVHQATVTTLSRGSQSAQAGK